MRVHVCIWLLIFSSKQKLMRFTVAAALASVVLATGAVYLLYSSVTGPGEKPRERTGRRKKKKKKRRKRKTSLKALAAGSTANLENDVVVETARVQKGYKKTASVFY